MSNTDAPVLDVENEGLLPLADFMRIYGVGKTRAYALMHAGVLDARIDGGRTLITRASAKAWKDALPKWTPEGRGPGRS